MPTTFDQAEQFDALAAALKVDTRDPAKVRQRVEMLEQLLEGLFVIPIINRRVGLDAIVGLLPGIGDAITAAMGAYLVWEARNLGLSRWHMARMAGNILVDAAVGAIPLLGDGLDFFFRSNSRNLRIIKRHLDRHHPATQVIEGTVRR